MLKAYLSVIRASLILADMCGYHAQLSMVASYIDTISVIFIKGKSVREPWWLPLEFFLSIPFTYILSFLFWDLVLPSDEFLLPFWVSGLLRQLDKKAICFDHFYLPLLLLSSFFPFKILLCTLTISSYATNGLWKTYKTYIQLVRKEGVSFPLAFRLVLWARNLRQVA